MNKKFVEILYKILRYTGLPILLRELFQRNKVTILMFHDIGKEPAQKAFEYLLKNYNVIGLNEYIEANKKKNHCLPKKALIITFDDGHIGNFELLPIIKDLQIPVTIFLCSEIINTKRHFWFLFDPLKMSKSDLKKLPNAERLKIMSVWGFEQTKEFDRRQALTDQQIKEMAPYVNFQSHTRFHPNLSKCEDKESFEEIEGSKISLEDHYGFHINSIAYPSGDYVDNTIHITKKAGYSCGLTVDHGYNDLHSDLYKLKRLSVNDTSDLNELIVKASGLWAYLKFAIRF